MGRTGTLILVCGLPGTGKTTVATQLARDRNAIRMCPDDWIEALLAHPEDFAERDRLRDPVENLQWDLARNYLKQGFTVVLENGFWAEEERSLYAMGAIELGSRIELIYLQVDKEELWRRIERRNAEMPSKTFLMSRGDLDDAWLLFQPPMPEELAFYDESVTIRHPL